MLADEIKKRMFDAMKRRDEVEKNILQVALGDIQTEAARSGDSVSDEQAGKIVRKIIKSNDESLAVVKDETARTKLERENEILQSLLPQTLNVEQIAAALAPVADQIKSAGNDGQATGVAMKHLKADGQAVDGKDVAQAVKRIRSAG